MRCNILVTNTSQSRNVRNERNIPDPGFYRLIEAHWLFLYTDRHRKLKFILQSGKKERYVSFPVFSISGTLLNFGQPDFINVQLIKDVYIYICTHVILSCFSFSLSLSSSRISRSPFCIAGWKVFHDLEDCTCVIFHFISQCGCILFWLIMADDWYIIFPW